jgi:hypothetical protein
MVAVRHRSSVFSLSRGVVVSSCQPRVQTPENCVGEITWSQEDRTCWLQALGSWIRGSVWDDTVLSELFQYASRKTP